MASTASWPDLVTFKRETFAVDTVGGSTSTLANTTPANVPARWRPLKASEKQAGDKMVAGADYVIAVPSQFSSALVDVDANSQAVLAARSGGEPERTFKILGVIRDIGLEIKVLASIEE